MFRKSLFVLAAVVSVFAVIEERCLTDFSIGYLYKEIGCKPVHEEASKCPSHFDCSNFILNSGRKTNGCNYKGENFEIGTELTVFKDNPCVSYCKCIKDGTTGHGVFTCANIDCFDWHLEDDNCTRLYSIDSCCSVKTHCKGDDPLPTCLVDGKVYVEGQRFYPETEPCKECHCMAGFEGKFVEPFCKDVSCGVELHYASQLRGNCVPIYYGKQGCCPIDWKCPNPTKDEKISFNEKAPKTTEALCKFGNLEFQQHEELKTSDPKLECKCIVPPYLTCTSLPNA